MASRPFVGAAGSHGRSKRNSGEGWAEPQRPPVSSDTQRADSASATDPYAVLEVSPTATDEEIRSSFRRLALKNHPDRAGGSAAAFKRLTEAFALIGEPSQRRKYDSRSSENHDGHTSAEIDVGALGMVDSAVAAVFSALGVSVKTAVSDRVLETAASGDVNLRPLGFGKTAGDRVEKGDAHFYELVVTPEQAAAGVIIRCASHGGSRFKLLKFDFDDAGSRSLTLTLTEECCEDRFNRGTMAGFFFLGFDTADVAAGHAGAHPSNEDVDCLLFRRLDGLRTRHPGTSCLPPGRHVFAVYGDNFLKSCKYHVTAVCSKQLPPGCPERLRQVEGLLWAKRQELAGFEEEYREAVRRYKSAQERYEAESKGLEDLLKQRLDAYDALGGSLVARRHERSATGSRMRSLDFDEEDPSFLESLGGGGGVGAGSAGPAGGRGYRNTGSVGARSPPDWDSAVPTVREESEERGGTSGAAGPRRADILAATAAAAGIPGCFGGAGGGRTAVADDAVFEKKPSWGQQRSVSSTGPATGGSPDLPPGGRQAGGAAQGGRLFSPGRMSVDGIFSAVRGNTPRSQSQNDAAPSGPASVGAGGDPLSSKSGTWGAGTYPAASSGPEGPASFPPRPPLARGSGGGGSFSASAQPGGGLRPGGLPQQGVPASWAVPDAVGAAAQPPSPPRPPPPAPRGNESFGSRDVTLELCDSDSELGGPVDDAATDSGFEIRFGSRVDSGDSAGGMPGPAGSAPRRLWADGPGLEEPPGACPPTPPALPSRPGAVPGLAPPRPMLGTQGPPPGAVHHQHRGPATVQNPAHLHQQPYPPQQQQQHAGRQQQPLHYYGMQNTPPGANWQGEDDHDEAMPKKRLPGHGLRKWVGRRLGTIPPKAPKVAG